MGFGPTWLRRVSPTASQNHFNHCTNAYNKQKLSGRQQHIDIDISVQSSPDVGELSPRSAGLYAHVMEARTELLWHTVGCNCYQSRTNKYPASFYTFTIPLL